MARAPDFRPFAYGHSGRLLTSTEANEVFCCDGDDEAPYFIHAMDGLVRGVRNVADGVLATDSTGALIMLAVPNGTVAWQTDLGVQPIALAATESGRWAVVHDRGVLYGRGPRQEGSVDLLEATAAAFANDDTLALLGEGGRLEICDLRSHRQTAVELGVRCNSIAWSALGWWLVAAEGGVYRIDADGGNPIRFLKWSGGSISSICASKAGGLCAFVTESHYVPIFGVVRDINCGTVIYPERTAYELEFGPDVLFGIGIGLGDGNKIDLRRAGGVARTDPPPDRPRNRWLIQSSYDPADVEQALQLEAAYKGGLIRFEGRDMITLGGAEAKPAPASTPVSPPPSQTAAEPESKGGGWLMVIVGLVLIAAVVLLWLLD
jgi:hypothetical protein